MKLLPPLPNSRIRVVLRYFLILVILQPDGVDLVILIPCRVVVKKSVRDREWDQYDDDMLKSGGSVRPDFHRERDITHGSLRGGEDEGGGGAE